MQKHNDYICANCKYDNHFDDADYCMICGTSLHNLCPNKNCIANEGEFTDCDLPKEALYCPYCGTETTHHEFLK